MISPNSLRAYAGEMFLSDSVKSLFIKKSNLSLGRLDF
jgi:hypothetical protein